MEKNRKNVRPKKEFEGVLDDKVSGKGEQVPSDYVHLENRVKSMDSSIDGTSTDIKRITATIIQGDMLAAADGSAKAKEQEMIFKQNMAATLKKSLSNEKAMMVTNQLVHDVKTAGVKKAADNFVENIDTASRKHSGVKVEAFAGNDAKGNNLAAMMEQRANKMQNIGKPPADNSYAQLSEAISRYIMVRDMRMMAVRTLRRIGRDLGMAHHQIMGISEADNGIQLSNSGLSVAGALSADLELVFDAARATENMSFSADTFEASRDAFIDSLLQKGMANMMRAIFKTSQMGQSLVMTQNRDEERVRS